MVSATSSLLFLVAINTDVTGSVGELYLAQFSNAFLKCDDQRP